MEIAVPPEGRNIDEIEADDFTLVKNNLGKNTRRSDVNMFEVAAENLKERVLKDGEDKAALKAENQQLRQYISNLLHGTSQTTLLLPQILETPAELVGGVWEAHTGLVRGASHQRQDCVDGFIPAVV
jgi:hypothetical protein